MLFDLFLFRSLRIIFALMQCVCEQTAVVLFRLFLSFIYSQFSGNSKLTHGLVLSDFITFTTFFRVLVRSGSMKTKRLKCVCAQCVSRLLEISNNSKSKIRHRLVDWRSGESNEDRIMTNTQTRDNLKFHSQTKNVFFFFSPQRLSIM